MTDSDIPAAAARGKTLASDFTVSLAADRRMYREDIAASIAHVKMLAKQNIVSEQDAESIANGLNIILQEIEDGKFNWRTELEDIHMNVEARLYELIGDTAGRLHTARSRNDQVATDARLYTKRIASECRAAARQLQRSLLDRAEQHVHTLIPGYTHLQRAQPVSFAHLLMAYYEMIDRDACSFGQAIQTADVLPLGSGAIAGATFPIDRGYVADQLGFSEISRNSIDAVSDRDFILQFIFATAKCMNHLSRLAEDLVIWSTSEFGFVTLSERYSSGSSMMPQKRNPDFAELIRGKSGRVIGSLVSVFTTLKGLPLTYNRDLQEDKPPMMDAADTVLASLEAAQGIINEMYINQQRIATAVNDPEILATDHADYLVREHAMPFREAYIAVANLYKGQKPQDINVPQIDAEQSVAARDIPGGTAPNQVKKAIMQAYGDLATAKLRGEF